MSEEEFREKTVRMLAEIKTYMHTYEERITSIENKMAKVSWAVVVGLIGIVAYFLKSGGVV